MVIFNGNRKNVSVTIPEGIWNVVCENGIIAPNGVLEQVKNQHYIVGASSASIMYLAPPEEIP